MMARSIEHAPRRLLPIRVGVSRCLLGEEVRYDGGHKRDRFLTEVVGRYVEWVPICPEVEASLGTPREAMRLVSDTRQPRLLTIKTDQDMTKPLKMFTEHKLEALEGADLSGYIFKKDSPSCGIERVPVFNQRGMLNRTGVGLFAGGFVKRFPLIPVEEEGRLRDPVMRDNFIERVFSYHRWQMLAQGPVSRKAVVEFHRAHKYLLLAHSRQHYESLSKLVARVGRFRPKELIERYGAGFMEALTVKATPWKHVNVLRHIVGHVKEQLATNERAELNGVVDDYQRGLVPLVAPITLIKHYAVRYRIDYVRNQVYLNPHPEELQLRNYL